MFMLWESTLLPGEDRHGWLGRLGRAARLAGAGRRRVGVMYGHCAASDFPETEADWLAMARAAGFRNGRADVHGAGFIMRCFASTARAS